MARDEYVERRMLNWVRWRCGAGDVGLGYGSASLWDRIKVDVSPNRESVIPTNAIEGSETEEAVRALPGYLRATVEVVYLTDDPVDAKAKRLACGVSTVHSRTREAHRLISIWFSDKAVRLQAAREQAEKVQAMARQRVTERK